jgi:catalase
MRPDEPTRHQTPTELARLGPELLEYDLEQRLSRGALRWHMVVAVGSADDPANDAVKARPVQHINVGTLVLQQAQPEADGPCRDFNYDPSILPRGIEPSDHPSISGRFSAYANPVDRRRPEAQYYSRAPAKTAVEVR